MSSSIGDIDPEMLRQAIEALKVKPGSWVLQFGQNAVVTSALHAWGLNVLDLDSEARSLESLDHPLDAVLFFRSFHRAADQEAVLRALDLAVKPGGKAVFAGEPISLEALSRAGWAACKHGPCLEVTRRKMWSYKVSGASKQLRTVSGTRTTSALRLKSAKPGFMLFGPFASFPAGRWSAGLTVRGIDGVRPTGICTMDVACGGQVYASREVKLEEGLVVLGFELSAHAPALEVRMFGDEPVEFEIVQLDISPAC